MGFILTIMSTLAGLFRRQSKPIAFCILVVLWVIFSLNTYNDDYIGYEFLFNNNLVTYEGSGQTVGFQALISAAKFFGLDFMQFRCVVGFICLFLMYSFISRYTKSIAFVLGLYILLPFLYDVVQFRFFLASCIAVYSLKFLIDNEKHGILYFIIGVGIASLIHTAAILFLAFLLVKLKDKILPAISILLFLILLVMGYSGLIVPLASQFIDSVKLEVYFTEMSRFGFLRYWVSIILMLLLIRGLDVRKALPTSMNGFMSGGENVSTIESGKPSSKGDMFVAFFYRAMYAYLPLMALIPLSTTNFYRPIRSTLILMFIYFAILVFDKRTCFSKKEVTLFILVFIIWFSYTCYFLFSGVWDLVVVTELTNNLLWS